MGSASGRQRPETGFSTRNLIQAPAEPIDCVIWIGISLFIPISETNRVREKNDNARNWVQIRRG